jgi:thymidylate kinase
VSRLYIIEGADGTGKTTLSNALLAETKGHLLHATFDKEWSIPEYHRALYESALTLLEYQDVILDRWSVSEEVYANAFRGGAQYSADEWMEHAMGKDVLNDPSQTVFIYCSNDSAIENHKENMKTREEMFDDMSPVVREYEKYMGRTALNWHRYDFTKVDMDMFVKMITIKENE